MKHKRILAMILAVASCLSLAVGASAANTTTRKATDFRDFDRTAWYAEAVSAAVDNGLLYGKSSSIIDPNGDMTRAEMAAIINRSFGCYKTADISQYKDVSKSKWYYKDVALAVQMGTYNGRSSSSMAPDAPISRQEAMTVVARALELDYDAYAKTDLSAFSDRSEISNWALPYVRAMVGADYIHGRTKGLEPLDNITRAEFAQIFYNIIGTYIVSKGTYDKDIKGSVLIRTDDVELKNLTVDGDLIIGCGAADGKIVLDNVTVKGRLLVWGGGTKAVYCNNATQMPAVVVARVDDAVKVIYDILPRRTVFRRRRAIRRHEHRPGGRACRRNHGQQRERPLQATRAAQTVGGADNRHGRGRTRAKEGRRHGHALGRAENPPR